MRKRKRLSRRTRKGKGAKRKYLNLLLLFLLATLAVKPSNMSVVYTERFERPLGCSADANRAARFRKMGGGWVELRTGVLF